MKYKNLTSFIRGIFQSEGDESRIPDDFLIQAHNVDITKTGAVERRRGYDFWGDIDDGNSIPSSDQRPDVISKTGFGKRIQTIASFINSAGQLFNIIIVDGKVYSETLDSENRKIWTLLNPSGDLTFQVKDKKVDIIKFYSSLFINDIGNDIYVYTPAEYSDVATRITQSRNSYFAGNNIFMLDNNYATRYFEDDIIFIGTASEHFRVAGDKRFQYIVGQSIEIVGHPVHDGFWEIQTVGYSSDYTNITIVGNLTSATIAGSVRFPENIAIDSNPKNVQGKKIYDSLVDIGLMTGAGPLADETELNFGYCQRVGTASTGFKYYVLSNQKNEAGNDACYIVEFDERFVAQSFKSVTMDPDGIVMSMSYKEITPGIGYLYIWAQDGIIHKYDINNSYADAGWAGGDVTSLKAPLDQSAKKIYEIAVNSTGVWVYTRSLPDKDDWYQPIPGYVPYSEDYNPSRKWTSAEIMSSNWAGWDDMVPQNHTVPVIYSSTGDNVRYVRDIIEPQLYVASWIHRHGQFAAVDHSVTPSENWIVNAFWALPQPISDLNHYNPVTFREVINDALFENTGFHGWCDGSNWSSDGADSFLLSQRIGAVTNGLVKTSDPGANCINNNYDYALWVNAKGKNSPLANIQYYFKYYKNNNFLFNKNRNTAGDFNPDAQWAYTLVGDTLEVRKEKVMLIEGEDFNSTYMTSKTEPDHVCLVNIEEFGENTGNILSFSTLLNMEDEAIVYRAVYPLGALADIEKLLPIQFETDTKISFGCQLVNGTNDLDNGVFCQLDLLTREMLFEESLESLCRKYYVPEFGEWVTFIDPDLPPPEPSKQVVVSKTFTKASSETTRITAILLDDFENNLFPYVQRTTSETLAPIELDQIRHIGTPDAPAVEVVSATTSNLIADTQFKYNMAFFFSSGELSHLSIQSDIVSVPNMHSDSTVDTVTSSTLFTTLAVHGLVVNDEIRFINPDVALPAELTTEKSYFVKTRPTTATFTISETLGGAQITNITDQTDNFRVIKLSEQPLKMVITGLDLLSSLGVQLYTDESVAEIQLYRSQKKLGEVNFTEKSLVATLSKDDAGLWYYLPSAPPYPPETYEDDAQTIAYQPFNYTILKSYPVKAMEVHKNRLILVRSDVANPNLIQYSTVDNAEDFAPTAVRDIYAGDGDFLFAAKSLGDYLYLFKEEKIYAILGDVAQGQLLDIAKSTGCPFKDLIATYDNRVIYFLNERSVYAVSGNRVIDLSAGRLENLFDPYRNDQIDFAMLDKFGYVNVYTRRGEIAWYLPKKIDGISPGACNFALIYNIEQNYFRTYGTEGFTRDITHSEYIKDLTTHTRKVLLGTAGGLLYESSFNKNDGGAPIQWTIKTKAETGGNDLSNKRFKIIKIGGRNLAAIRITYWIDGHREVGSVQSGKLTGKTKEEITVLVTGHGADGEIIVEISGEDINNAPAIINQILIGYDDLIGSMR